MRTMVNRQPQDAERVYASGLYLSGNDRGRSGSGANRRSAAQRVDG
ncbi:hypothetical protein IE996_22940 [Klebsiella pneumoniae]|uniref:Uncharacterized protein n=1 Tax=Klebsiella pneumoniae TaxID=573 RepID=A0A927DLZ1_KLEPN|nr:hypothetical protein [Klebsiella pneumoniae]MBD3722325.1 hypothetical protein [Klebsiella pneumoniae]